MMRVAPGCDTCYRPGSCGEGADGKVVPAANGLAECGVGSGPRECLHTTVSNIALMAIR
jgi:hypothetical protein